MRGWLYSCSMPSHLPAFSFEPAHKPSAHPLGAAASFDKIITHDETDKGWAGDDPGSHS